MKENVILLSRLVLFISLNIIDLDNIQLLQQTFTIINFSDLSISAYNMQYIHPFL